MAHERCAERLAALGIPEPHGLVPTRRGEALAVGAEGDAHARALMARERCAERLAALGIPEPHGLVPTRRGEALAVGAEGDARHDGVMATQNLLELRIGQQCRKERALRLRRRLGLSRADGFIREQQGEVDAMVFFLFRGDGQTPGVRPLCFGSASALRSIAKPRATLPAGPRPTQSAVRSRDLFRVPDPPLLLFFLGGLAGPLCRATGVQVSPFD